MYQKLAFDYQYLQQQLSELKRLVFGSKSERFVATEDGQLDLFTKTSTTTATSDSDAIEITYQREQQIKPKQQPVIRFITKNFAYSSFLFPFYFV
ncbi:transposase [Aquimarina sp. RZ0]|uniref:transposase n=1 Tax=Aquimarina sp. RZ0 TaxID=2607730 RepID=UPI00165F6A11|nr:transposase [Aquimarina sp. RZ0]